MVDTSNEDTRVEFSSVDIHLLGSRCCSPDNLFRTEQNLSALTFILKILHMRSDKLNVDRRYNGYNIMYIGYNKGSAIGSSGPKSYSFTYGNPVFNKWDPMCNSVFELYMHSYTEYT